MAGRGKLFKARRDCVACSRTATPKKRVPGEPNILSINLSLYRCGEGKGIHKAARRVTICEEDFLKACVGGLVRADRQAKTLLEAVLESLSACYNAILDEDQGYGSNG